MWNALFSFFKKEVSAGKLGEVATHIDSIVSLFNQNYLNDKNAKNAAIDSVIEILIQHKDQ
jgi:hypothetical protein